jgi:PAS domain S-box-containing protein
MSSSDVQLRAIDDRCRAQPTARVGEAEIRVVIDGIPGLVSTMTPSGAIELVNRRILDYFGKTLDDLKTWSTGDAIHPDDLDRTIATWERVVASGEPFELEHRLRRADGMYRWFQLNGSPVRNERQEIVRWYHVLIDIDDRKRAEEAALAGERNLRLAIDTIPGLVCTKTPAGEVDSVNQPILAYTGKTLEEMRGWPALVHPDDREVATSRWIHSVHTGEPFEAEFRVLGANGLYRWFHARGLPLRGADGQILRWYSLFTDVDDRKHAEEVLRASERELRLIVDNIPGFVATMTARGDVEFFSRPVLAYTGLTRDELRDWRQLVHPDELPLVRTLWQRSIDTGEPYDVEHRLRRADGTFRWFHARGLASRDDGGRPVRWYVLLSDIEERRRIEERLRHSESDLLDAQRLTRTGSWKHDLATGAVIVSPEILRRYGIEPDEDTSQTGFWFDRVHPDDRARVLETFQRAERERGDYEDDYRIVLPDQTIRYQHAIGHAIVNEVGALVAFVGTSMDVTEQTQARAALESAFDEIKRLKDQLQDENLALRASEEDLRLILNNVPGWVYTLNPAGEIELVNQQLLNFLDTGLDDLKEWNAFVHPDDRERVTQLFASMVREGRGYDVEQRIRRGDGVYRWCSSRGIPLRDADGRIVRWYGLVTDIDDRRSAEEALRRTQARLSQARQAATAGELAASIAHEVNQPLTAVAANAQACLGWLSGRPPDLAKASEAATRIARDARDAGEIIRRIRALYKPASPAKVPLQVNGVIGEVVHLLRSEIERRRVTIALDLQDDIPSVLGDRVQLQQLVLNLLLNGLEAMDAIVDGPKTLFIRSGRESGDAVLVQVEDTGEGLRDPTRIFEPFFTTKETGMGMGLAICRSIVEGHDGLLWVVPGQGPGATFCFSLPIHPDAAS